MVKYSFVIPVYNVEKYLSECVDSILNQTYQDFEIILVDDGATDKSPEICDRFAENDSRVRVIHKKNEGLSAARNTGLLDAKGEFVIFLDSDDYWCDNTGLLSIDKLFDSETDIVAFSSKNYYEATKTATDDRYNYNDEMNSLSPVEQLKYMISNDLFNVHAAKRAFRKSFLIDNQIFYKPGIRSEDIEMYVRLSNCLPKYKYLNKKLYIYRHREGSITQTISGDNLSELLETVESFSDYEFVNDDVKNCLFSYLAYSMSLVLAYVAHIKPSNSKELIKRIKKCSWMYDYTIYPRTKLISKCYHLLGFNITKFLLGIYLGRKH